MKKFFVLHQGALRSFGISIPSAGVIYLLGSFISATWDISQWDGLLRFFLAVCWSVIAGVSFMDGYSKDQINERQRLWDMRERNER